MHAKTTALPSLKVQALAAGLLVAFSAASYAAPSSGSSKTAQGIFVKMVTPAELAIEQNIQYKFDPALAAAYFTNAWDGAAPTVQCTGGSPTLCGTSRPTTAPAAPAPLAARVADAISANRCVWMDGGLLNPASYTQTVPVSVGKLNYQYTYTYVLAPGAEPIGPKTAWVYDRTLGGASAADLDINAQIAGESVVVSNQFPAPGKFSFSLAGSDGLSRVSNLVYTVTEANGLVAPVSMAVLSSMTNATDMVIESYNGGSNGNTALLWNQLPAAMSTILNNDAAPNNNNGGADGSAMAVETVQQATFTLPPGDYLINLSGTVKDNAASATTQFNIQNRTKITYVGSHCGQ